MRADIKTRGVLVGEVLAFDTDAEGAVVTLGIFPDKLETIPANVTGSIVPKTLFGEKYVSLEIPESGPTGTLEAGATIPRTEVSIEVEEVLSDLYPLLRAVSPADINYTLNALATALEGRGEAIGENLETFDAYLQRVNPQIPDLVGGPAPHLRRSPTCTSTCCPRSPRSCATPSRPPAPWRVARPS